MDWELSTRLAPISLFSLRSKAWRVDKDASRSRCECLWCNHNPGRKVAWGESFRGIVYSTRDCYSTHAWSLIPSCLSYPLQTLYGSKIKSIEMEVDNDRPSPPASLGRLTSLNWLDYLPVDSVILFHPHQNIPALSRATNLTRNTHSRSGVDAGARGCVNIEGEGEPSSLTM